MLLALYGHPDSGGIWGTYFEKQIGKKGWQSVLKEIWRSVFYHPEFDALLVVYVDDLKLAAPTRKIKAAWKSTSSMIDIDDPEPFNRYFGCEHREERDIKLNIKEHPFYDIFSTDNPLPRKQELKTTGLTTRNKTHIPDITCILGRGVLFPWTKVLQCLASISSH